MMSGKTWEFLPPPPHPHTLTVLYNYPNSLKGPYIKDARKIFGILDPLPPLSAS